MWDHVEKSLADGDAAGDAPHDNNPEIDRGPPPRIVFFAALIANGWFLRAKSFTYSPGVGSVPSRFKVAFSRWLLFLVFWIVALVFAPTLQVGLVFAIWLVWIVRDLRRITGNLNAKVELTPEK